MAAAGNEAVLMTSVSDAKYETNDAEVVSGPSGGFLSLDAPPVANGCSWWRNGRARRDRRECKHRCSELAQEE